MGRVNREIAAVGAAEVELAGGAEAIVCTLDGVDTTTVNDTVVLTAEVPISAGVESVLQTVRIRRTGVEGAEVAKAELTTVASTQHVVTLSAVDEPGEIAGGKYVVTLAGTATKVTKALKATLRALV